MKKGIMVPFFTEIDMFRRLDLIKQAGFTSFMLSMDPAHEKFTAPLDQVVNYCNQIGLTIACGHAAYKDPDINTFWLEGPEGDAMEAQYTNDLFVAAKHNIKTVVYHMHFELSAPLSMVGIERLARMTKIAEQLGVNIAVENLYKYDELEFIFKHISSPNLGMCYDTGHENFLTPNANFINKYGHLLKACHIHDNDGITDQHKTPFSGSINWNNIAKGFAKANAIALESEVRIYRPAGKDKVTESELLELLKHEYAALSQFEQLVQKYKLAMQTNNKNKE